MNENLIPFNELSQEEARELGRKGGINSGKTRRKKKLMREQMELLLSLPLKDKGAEAKLKALGIDEKNIDNQMAMIIALWNKALKGDTKAVEIIRDTIGEKPKEEIEYKDITPKWFKE